jgi:oxaloacetate decarboxylase alpha subunit
LGTERGRAPEFPNSNSAIQVRGPFVEFDPFSVSSLCYTPQIACMTLKELKEIIEIVTSQESIEELEIEKSGVRLRIKRALNHGSLASAAADASAAVVPATLAAPALAEVSAESEGLFYLKSPIVGTFYRASTPNSEPFASVGDIVEKGTVLCIIEAMKLMNEIESEVAGEIVSILVENGQPVEYGEKLFAIRSR